MNHASIKWKAFGPNIDQPSSYYTNSCDQILTLYLQLCPNFDPILTAVSKFQPHKYSQALYSVCGRHWQWVLAEIACVSHKILRTSLVLSFAMREKEVVKIVLHLFSFLEIFCIPPSSYMVNIACVSHKILITGWVRSFAYHHLVIGGYCLCTS